MNPWQLLELEPGASEQEIRRAWKRLARKHHPDLNPGDPQAEARFKKLSAAYEQLMAGGHVPGPSRGFDQDGLAMLAWIVEVQLRELKEQTIPGWVQVHGSGPVLMRTLLDHLDRLDEVPRQPAGWFTRRRVKPFLANLRADIVEHGPRHRLILVEPRFTGTVDVYISVPALAAQGPWDEDELREVVQKALTAGVVAALPLLFKVPSVPLHLDEARRAERAGQMNQRFWQVVWALVALLSVVFIGGALLGWL